MKDDNEAFVEWWMRQCDSGKEMISMPQCRSAFKAGVEHVKQGDVYRKGGDLLWEKFRSLEKVYTHGPGDP